MDITSIKQFVKDEEDIMTYAQICSWKQGLPIDLLRKTGQVVEISIHRPSPFIARNLERVVPDWILPVLWVVVVLQQSRYEFVETTPHVEREKECLRENFMRFGCNVAFKLRDCTIAHAERDRGFLTELIDPRTGYPLLSRPGEISHDDTAVVKALLGFPIIHNSCRVVEHPSWGTAVYPSIMMSSASPKIIRLALKQVALQHEWKQPKVDFRLSSLGA